MTTNTSRLRICLWFEDQAEDAAQFYTSIFERSSMGRVTRFGEEGMALTGKGAGTVMTVDFEIDGQRFTALNGGAKFQFNDSVSVVVNCRDQGEVDHYWTRLTDGGQGGRCGWLKDRFGVSWQVVPNELHELLSDPDAAKAARVTAAMLGMKKLDLAGLRAAHTGAA